MRAPDELDFLVLHTVRLKAVAGLDALADTLGRDDDTLAPALDRLGSGGWIRWRDGSVPGWSLTPPGRNELARRLADELDASGARSTVEAIYQRFLVLNPRLLRVCTDWQLVPGPSGGPVRNDHEDAVHDAAVIERLRSIDDAVQPLCDELAAVLPRFGSYGRRLATALERTLAGDGQWLDRPVIDSYHTVWFELHEDLLATLGLARSQERSA